MPRFFAEVSLSVGARVTLPEEVAHHALRVLRLRDGDEVVVFNGTGGEYHGRLESRGRRGATVQVNTFDAREAELPIAISIAQGLSAAERMDWTLEKAVELGAQCLQPLAMARSVTRLSAERAARRHGHWCQIVRSASEQCGRNRIAAVLPLAQFESWIKDQPAGTCKLMLDVDAETPLARVARPASGVGVVLLAGPEAGMTPAEKEAARAHGFIGVSLGPRVLRTETAAVAALATLAALWCPPDA